MDGYILMRTAMHWTFSFNSFNFVLSFYKVISLGILNFTVLEELITGALKIVNVSKIVRHGKNFTGALKSFL